MIVSHAHRFIFIRTRKTAGTSLELALSRIVRPGDIVTPVCERDEALRRDLGSSGPQNYLEPGCTAQLVGPSKQPGMRFYNHMPASEVHTKLPHVWNNYFKFCFERNPWDKVLSLYYHRHRGPIRPSLDEFIDCGEYLDAKNLPLYFEAGELQVDFVGQYEQFASDLAVVAREIAVELPELPRAKAQFRADKTLRGGQALSAAQRDAIERGYADELAVNAQIARNAAGSRSRLVAADRSPVVAAR